MTDTRFLKRYRDDLGETAFPEMMDTDPILTNIPWMSIPNTIVEPDDWDLLWDRWNANKGPFTKAWDGLCIWNKPSPDCDIIQSVAADDWSKLFPKMFDHIRSLMPFSVIDSIVLRSNVTRVPPHIDLMAKYYPWPNSLKVMLWDTNDKPTFYCLPWPEETYNQPAIPTRNHCQPGQNLLLGNIPGKDKIYVDLPPDSNTFVVSNGEYLHGADMAKPKLMLLVQGLEDPEPWKKKLHDIIRDKK
jgi:hypothetical protein